MITSGTDRLKLMATLFTLVGEVWNRRFPRATSSRPAGPGAGAAAANPSPSVAQFRRQAEGLPEEELRKLRLELAQGFLKELDRKMGARSPVVP